MFAKEEYKMRALVYDAPKTARLHKLDEPIKSEGEVLIDVKYCGVCGSDIGIYLGTHPRAKAPLVFGHEFIGTLAEDGVKFKKGDRVIPFPLLSCGECLACRTGNSHVCNTLGLIGIDKDGGMSERVYVNEDVLFKIPENVTDRAAATIEPLAVVLRAVHQADFQACQSAVVVGAGPIGMLTALLLKNIGASEVVVSDIFENRLQMAKEFGFITVNPNSESLEDKVKSLTNGEGCDVLFECSGSESAALEMTEICRVSGTICMVSVHKVPHKVNLQKLNFKEQKLIGTRVYTKEEFGQAVKLSEKMQKDLEKIVTHIVPLSESENVFNMFTDPTAGTIKVVVDCQL
jgi:2-desacetyl-2-hydroxyethyl bacteriochlorophyllide A dehydrogenase